LGLLGGAQAGIGAGVNSTGMAAGSASLDALAGGAGTYGGASAASLGVPAWGTIAAALPAEVVASMAPAAAVPAAAAPAAAPAIAGGGLAAGAVGGTGLSTAGSTLGSGIGTSIGAGVTGNALTSALGTGAAQATGNALTSALLPAAATVAGGLLQSNSANKAVDAQQAATDAAIAEQRRQYDLTRADYAPYREAGTNALTQLQTGINTPTTAADVMQDPGYQFGLDQGQQAIDRKIAASGGRVSGASIKAASQYGTNYATTGYGAADSRRNERLNRLAALAGIGQTATAGTNALNQNSTNNTSNLVSSQGNATGAANLAQGNIWANSLNQLGAIGQRWATGG
jgi:hypothetical protein